MSAPSQMLAELIPSEIILQELAPGVKSLPTVGACPSDAKHKAHLYPDKNSVWAACPECGFAGDSIDILKAKYQVQSVEAILSRLERSGIGPVPQIAVSTYYSIKSRRVGVSKFVEEARQNVKRGMIESKYIALFGAKSPLRQEWVEGVGRFVGVADKDTLCNTLGISEARTADNLLLFPYYDLPGRVSNFKIMSCNSRGLVTTDRNIEGLGGLFMLESVASDSEYIIAVDNPLFACRLQLSRMQSVLKSLPIVAWHKDTTYWPMVNKKIVFWAPQPTPDVFKQARLVPGSRICTPSGTADYDKMLQHNDIKNWTYRVINSSRTWARAAKEHLLSLQNSQAMQFVRELDLTPVDIGEIMYDCSQEEKKAISQILDVHSAVKSVRIGDSQIVARDGAWWSTTTKGHTIRVSNATFTLERSAHYKNEGSYLIGTLSTNGKSERFMAPADKLMAQPGKWLRDFALKHGLGLVQVFPGWDKRLIDIATSMNTDPLVHIESSAIVGWSSDLTRFTFPGLTLISGRVDECDLGLPMEGMPCSRVSGRPTPKGLWKEFTEDSPVNRTFWATLACVMANTCARYFGHDILRVGVIGPQRHMFLLTAPMGLGTVHMNKPSSVSDELQALSMHDVPCVVAILGKFHESVDWLTGAGYKNMLMGLNRTQAAMINSPDWVMVDARDTSGQSGHICSGTNLMADVIRMAQQQSSAGKVQPAVEMLDQIYEWGKINKDVQDPSVFEGAKKLITYDSVYGTLPLVEGFLFSLFALLQDGRIQAGCDGGVILEDKQVHVPKSVMQNMFMTVSTGKLTEALKAAEYTVDGPVDGWDIQRGKWDAIYAHWLAVRDA